MAIGEVFLGAFLTVLLEKMASGEWLKYFRNEGIEAQQMMKWSTKLSKIQAFLIDAEEKQLTDRAVNLWLDDLQDLAYDLDDIVDEFATEVKRRMLEEPSQASTSSKVWNFIPTCCTNFKQSESNFQMGSEVEKIDARLRNSYEQCCELNLVKTVVGTRPGKTWQKPETTSSFCEPCIYGREQDQRKIIELLVGGDESRHNNVDVIPIVGMGGIGKTTLAQMVYNDETVKKHFDLQAWVCVYEFDIMKITKAILGLVTKAIPGLVNSETCSFNSLEQVQVQLKQTLAGKKFFIVLDDVWNKNYNDWNRLMSPFHDGARGSKFVVTTRDKDVASRMGTVKLHDVEELSDDDCWSLFKQHAFKNGSIEANPNLESIGKEIVKKCRGLPLAARTLGGLLCGKVRNEEWAAVLCSKIWDLPEDKSDILPALRLSYHHLPRHLKQCFAYCSIIPYDYEFEEEELVLLWMAEGFIQQQRDKQLEDVGREYFHELLSRSFFQPSSTGKSSKFVMHDLINDLAQIVARDTCFRLEDKLKNQDHYKNLKKARHSSYVQGNHDGIKKFEIFKEAMHLRTFLPFSLLYDWDRYLASNVPLKLLPKLRCLRVFSMSGYHINELPRSIGDLKHMRYLNLSYTDIEELPESVGSLYNLQTLMLRGCQKLKKLPTDMGKLIDLHHLDTTAPNLLTEMPLGIGKLASLQTLSNFIVVKDNGSRIGELGNLIHLQGKLCLSGLQNVVNPQDARVVNLNDKQGLDELSMEWSVSSNDSRDGRVEIEVLDMLRPHKNIKKLHIKFYFGTRFPTWMDDPLFCNMAHLSLENCKNCTSLPPLGQLPLLKDLCIKGMSALKHVSCKFYGQGSAKPFPLLETLSFENMLEWEDWYTFGDRKEVQPFTHVRELSIIKCPKLLGTLPSDLPCLKNLEIMECPQLLVKVSNLILPSLTSLSMSDVPLPSLQVALDTRNMVDDEVMKLEQLNIAGCEEVKTLWKNQEILQHSHPACRRLEINGCPQFVSLFEEENDEENEGQHQQLEGLPSIARLEHLEINNCEKLEKLPRQIRTFTFLRELHVYECPSLGSFPEAGFPSTLRKLAIRDCKALQSIFGWTTQISDNNLEVLNVAECPSLTCLISCRGGLPLTLKYLMIRRCEKLEALLVEEGMKINCPSLESVRIWDCDRLKYLPDALHNNNFKNRNELDVSRCKNLESIPEAWFHSATNLTQLDIRGCKKLKAIQLPLLPHGLQTINYLNSLQGLRVNISHWNSSNLQKIGVHSLTSLRRLTIEGPISVAEEEEEEDPVGSSFPMDGMLLPTSLTFLKISKFPNMEKISSKVFENLASLECIWIENCPRLKSFPVERLPPSLKSLWIWDCPRLESFPLNRLPPDLEYLWIIRGSPILVRKCEKGNGEYWPFLAHIPQVIFGD